MTRDRSDSDFEGEGADARRRARGERTPRRKTTRRDATRRDATRRDATRGGVERTQREFLDVPEAEEPSRRSGPGETVRTDLPSAPQVPSRRARRPRPEELEPTLLEGPPTGEDLARTEISPQRRAPTRPPRAPETRPPKVKQQTQGTRPAEEPREPSRGKGKEKGKPKGGRRLGPYVLRRVLGKGGMGVVYEAFEPRLQRTVALKVISGSAGTEELERFMREARAAAKLKHPNIVPIYEVGVHEGEHYFTMEMVRGETLQSAARSGRIKPPQAAELVAKVARAIHYAHDQGIIHRDLKPANVLIDEKGEPQVMDFGLAKDVTEAHTQQLTLTGIAMGSPPYMPPEQARGQFHDVDEVSDVYGLGAVLYECLTGRAPFTGKSLYDVISKVLVDEPEPPSKSNSEVKADLETICLKAMDKEKWRRYASAEDLARDLERFLDDRSILARRLGLTTKIARTLERNRAVFVAVLLPLAVAASLASYVFGAQRAVPPEPEPLAPMAPAGPMARSIQSIAQGGNGVAPLAELLESPPTWVALGSGASNGGVAQEVIGRSRGIVGEGVGPSAELLCRMISDLAASPRIDAREVERSVRQWLAGESPEVVELMRRAALAQHGAIHGSAGSFERALQGNPPTPLDVAIVRGAVLRLSGGFRNAPDPRLAAAAAVTSRAQLREAAIQTDTPLRKEPSGRVTVRLVQGAQPAWSFPPVRLPGEGPEVTYPWAPGLYGPDQHRIPPPTPAFSTLDGGAVVVGWLRFLYVLDAQTGAVVRRQRLPGFARELTYTTGGVLEVGLAQFGAERGERLARVLVELGPAANKYPVALQDARGRPVHPLDLLPVDAEVVALDELRVLAAAQFSLFNRNVEVWERTPGGAERMVEVLTVTPPLGKPLDLGLDEKAPYRVVLGKPLGALPNSSRLQEKLADDARPSRVRRVVGRRDRVRIRFPTQIMIYPATPDESVEETAARLAGVLRSIKSGTLLEGGADPNPWQWAFAAAASARWSQLAEEGVDLGAVDASAPDAAQARTQAESWAATAAAAGHLPPQERVELAIVLDEARLWNAADAALDRALRDLVRDHAFVPEWSGYGLREPGLLLEEQRLRQQQLAESAAEDGQETLQEVLQGRAQALGRWRDVFSPLRAAPLQADADAAVDAAVAGAGPPRLTGVTVPPRGVGGLGGLALLRLYVAILFNRTSTFVLVLVWLTYTFWRRHKRAVDRDLRQRCGIVDRDEEVSIPWRDRVRVWRETPLKRLELSWPTRMTLFDKLSLVVIYTAFFVAFSVLDVGLDALVKLREAPESLLMGLPAAPEGLELLDERVEAESDVDLAYLRAWAMQARGEPAAEVGEAYKRVLELEPNHLAATLGFAELWSRQSSGRERAKGLIEQALTQDPESIEAQVLLARLEGRDVKPLMQQIGSARQRLSWSLFEECAYPLAPLPGGETRDRLVLGTKHWSDGLLGQFMTNLLFPIPGQIDRALDNFAEAWDLQFNLGRMKNRLFWLVPACMLLIAASLFVRPKHAHQWHPSDEFDRVRLRKALLLELRYAVPGVWQVNIGHPIRGALMFLSFVLPSYLLLGSLTNNVNGFEWLEGVGLYHILAMTGESELTLQAAWRQHQLELGLLVVLAYLTHWADLTRTARRLRELTRRESAQTRDRIEPQESVDSLIPTHITSGDDPAPAGGGFELLSSDDDVEDSGPFDESLPQRR